MSDAHELEGYLQHVRNTLYMARCKRNLIRERSIVMQEQTNTLVTVSQQTVETARAETEKVLSSRNRWPQTRKQQRRHIVVGPIKC